MCEAKGLKRGLEQKGEGKGGVASLSHPPTASKAAPFPGPEKRHLPSKKVPTGYEEKGLWPGKAKRSPQHGSGPVHFNSCTLMEDHKKGPSLALGWGSEEVGVGGTDLGGGISEKRTLNLVPNNLFGLDLIAHR